MFINRMCRAVQTFITLPTTQTQTYALLQTQHVYTHSLYSLKCLPAHRPVCVACCRGDSHQIGGFIVHRCYWYTAYRVNNIWFTMIQSSMSYDSYKSVHEITFSKCNLLISLWMIHSCLYFICINLAIFKQTGFYDKRLLSGNVCQTSPISLVHLNSHSEQLPSNQQSMDRAQYSYFSSLTVKIVVVS